MIRAGVLMLWMLVFSSAHADNWKQVLDLRGQWLFAIGDNVKWSQPTYNDREWEPIRVPAKWEDHGFSGYNGFAWYRKTFDGTRLQDKGLSYSLFLGYVDDVDEVYVNGHKIGSSGAFPPRYHTAYNAKRIYVIPSEYLSFTGKNVIAVRVYDAEIEGGIVNGDIGIYTNEDDKAFLVTLRGLWDFCPLYKRDGSMRNEKRTPPESARWTNINVPELWEHQGFHYDGTAWYRKQFFVPANVDTDDLILILGKVDDYDQTYINGKLVGSTAKHDHLRVYYLKPDVIVAGSMNLLLVYVDDPQGLGGIYEGPVGIMKQSQFTRFMRYRDR